MRHRVFTLAARIFDECGILLSITHTELKAIEMSKQIEIKVTEGRVDTARDWQGLAYSHATDAGDYIRKRLLGSPIATEDERVDNIQLTHKFTKRFTVNDIVELWTATSCLRFINTADILTVRNLLREYLENIHNAEFDIWNYQKPPEEDIFKITSTLEGLEEVANAVASSGEIGDDNWSRFLESVGFVTTFAHSGSNAAIKGMEVRKKTPQQHAALLRGTGQALNADTGTPFDFLKR